MADIIGQCSSHCYFINQREHLISHVDLFVFSRKAPLTNFPSFSSFFVVLPHFTPPRPIDLLQVLCRDTSIWSYTAVFHPSSTFFLLFLFMFHLYISCYYCNQFTISYIPYLNWSLVSFLSPWNRVCVCVFCRNVIILPI